MNQLNIQELEKVAEAYESLLAPALFVEWTHRLTDAADIREGQHVLDVACGTGMFARVIAERVGPDGSVSALDANPGMLAVANRVAPAIQWREGGAEALPYEAVTREAEVALKPFQTSDGSVEFQVPVHIVMETNS